MAKGQNLKLLSLLNEMGVFGNFWLRTLAVLTPLGENLCLVPHLKAFISGSNLLRGLGGGSTFSL